jgi:hypothetical protein
LNIGAADAISAPVFVPPVKVIALIFGCDEIALLYLMPWTIFNTPAAILLLHISDEGMQSWGNFHCFHNSIPVINAGAIFQVNRYKGRFHGDMRPLSNGCLKYNCWLLP